MDDKDGDSKDTEVTDDKTDVKEDGHAEKEDGDWYQDANGVWINRKTGEKVGDNKTEESDEKEEGVIESLDGKESWYFDESTSEWVNRATGERIADGKKEETAEKEEEIGEKDSWSFDEVNNVWTNSATGETWSEDGGHGEKDDKETETDKEEADDKDTSGDKKDDWYYDEASGQFINRGTGERVGANKTEKEIPSLNEGNDSAQDAEDAAITLT